MIRPEELDPAAVESAVRATAAGPNLAREVIATYLNHVYEDDEAMTRGAIRQNPAYDAATHDSTRGKWRGIFREAFIDAVRGGEA